ncbi:unnamed protein product [Caenorhabditis bovis]|uniref:UPAR/Ly6 domain-containing protein n=1 Tax=Caenorhabditis bovis TaxID=2654633 RepID=A0A8S1FGE9_9PELO|nr:unnamed protein product [Caenorhabditis bovis]
MRIILLTLLLSIVLPTRAIRCHSCLTYCKMINGRVDPNACDCKSPENEQCEANACFAKVELFPEETTAIVQKGCVSDIPAGQRGCQYASNTDTIHCFCDQDQCNTRHKMSHFIPSRLPSVDCCLCSASHGDTCEKTCTSKCRGNYCVVDFDGGEQGCGVGIPRLPSFLRTDDYLAYHGEYICANPSHVMNGCVCTDPSGICNEMNKTREFQKKQVVQRRPENQHYCYALMHKAYKPFGQEVFKKSSTCEGHFCFISLTTSEIVLESADFKHNYEDHDEFIGIARPRYEMQAGCIKVDDDQKVTVGCTVETQGNTSEILAKHCICDSHLCNFYHLTSGTADPRPKAKGAETVSSQSNKPSTIRLFTGSKDESKINEAVQQFILPIFTVAIFITF